MLADVIFLSSSLILATLAVFWRLRRLPLDALLETLEQTWHAQHRNEKMDPKPHSHSGQFLMCPPPPEVNIGSLV
jgi:hypothetical protein